MTCHVARLENIGNLPYLTAVLLICVTWAGRGTCRYTG